MTNIREILAKNLRENRQKLGLTQAELAEKSEISNNFLAMIELKHKFPAPETLERLAAALCIETFELFTTPVSPQNVLEKLHMAILNDLNRAIDSAVEKAVNKRCKTLSGVI